MARLLTRNIATMTEMREPQKVLDRAGGKPVAVLKNSRCVAYFVPAEATMQQEPRYASREDVLDYFNRSRDRVQPVLDYLKDK